MSIPDGEMILEITIRNSQRQGSTIAALVSYEIGMTIYADFLKSKFFAKADPLLENRKKLRVEEVLGTHVYSPEHKKWMPFKIVDGDLMCGKGNLVLASFRSLFKLENGTYVDVNNPQASGFDVEE